MEFHINIQLDNDLFIPNPDEEVRRILLRLSQKIMLGQGLGHIVYDSNGNIVGYSTVKGEWDDDDDDWG